MMGCKRALRVNQEPLASSLRLEGVMGAKQPVIAQGVVPALGQSGGFGGIQFASQVVWIGWCCAGLMGVRWMGWNVMRLGVMSS